jgi:hypothetical protein
MSLNALNNNFNSLPKTFSEELQGEWVAALNGEIIQHNRSFKILFKEISNQGLSKRVIFHKIPKKEIIIV